MEHCHICYSIDETYTCESCDELYCLDCSYTYTIHYQYEGNLCYRCSEQKRIKPLSKEIIRDNKIEIILK
jgi:hypothetical protein